MALARFIDLWRRRRAEPVRRYGSCRPDTPTEAVDDRDTHDDRNTQDDRDTQDVRDSDTESFQRTLLRILNSQPTTAAGKINFVNLDPLKERLGERWDRVGARVDQLVCKVIESHLAPEDLYSRYDELNYLVVFASLGEEMAAFKCAKISEQIFSALLGVDGMAMAGVRSLAAGIDGKMVTVDKSLSECVAALAESAEERALAKGRVTTIDARGGDALRRSASGADAPNQAPTGTDGGMSQNGDASAGDQAIACRYSPFWNVGKQAVTAFRCAADQSNADGRAWTRGIPDTISLFSAFDLQTLWLGSRRLEADLHAGTKYLCVLPVGLATITQPKSRDLYLDCLDSLPADVRSCMALELTGIPADVPSSRLEEVSGIVKPMIHELLWLLEPKSIHVAKKTPQGATGVGIDIGASKLGEAEVIGMLNNFAIAAERRKLSSYLVGAPTRSLILAAAAAGFLYIDGSGMLGSLSSPQTMFAFNWSDLYGDLSPEGSF